MSTLALILLLALNVGIAWLNCWACGRSWVESKAVGGWTYLVCWCGAVQAVIGFSMPFLLGGVWIAGAADLITPVQMWASVALWYLLVILPCLGTGIVLMVESWRVAWRDRDLLSIGSAGWNTMAQIHNSWGAIEGIGNAFGAIGNALSGDDDDNPLARLGLIIVVLIAVGSIAAGLLITMSLIKHYAGTVPLPERPRASARAWRA